MHTTPWEWFWALYFFGVIISMCISFPEQGANVSFCRNLLRVASELIVLHAQYGCLLSLFAAVTLTFFYFLALIQTGSSSPALLLQACAGALVALMFNKLAWVCAKWRVRNFKTTYMTLAPVTRSGRMYLVGFKSQFPFIRGIYVDEHIDAYRDTEAEGS